MRTNPFAGVINAAVARAHGHPVRRLRIRIGAFHPLMDVAFHDAFASSTRGTRVEGAAVDMIIVPADFHCLDCGCITSLPEELEECPACGSLKLRMWGGDELMLDSVEVAELVLA